MTRRNHPGLDPAGPHAIDHIAYADGVQRPELLLRMEDQDNFWLTLGGSIEDPYGDGGEFWRQRQKAIALGIGHNIYGPMGLVPKVTPSGE